MSSINNIDNETPLIVKLVENPKFDIPRMEIFNGSVDINSHDCIHVLLGRGLLSKDEAFVIGFTMGSTSCVTTLEEHTHSLVSRYLYPGPYKLDILYLKKRHTWGMSLTACH